MRKHLLLLCVLLSYCQYTTAQLITYNAPRGSLLNTDFTVKVRERGKQWQPLATYLAKVTNVIDAKSVEQNTSFSYFDFAGKVEVSVTYNKGNIAGARIRPLSYNIIPAVLKNTITFTLDVPKNISIEVNGDIFHNLQIFANPIEKFKPSPADTNVIYYGPGFHQAGTIKLKSNKTVYIAGGAVVQGEILINHAENVHVRGHGILTQLSAQTDPVENSSSAAKQPRRGRNDELVIEYSKNVEVDGLIVLPHKYSVLMGQASNVTINNLKSLSSEGNADGIDIFCSTDVAINNVFMRNADDCVCVYGHRWAYYGNTKNITVSNSVLWADVAHPILVGTHGDTQHPDTLENMKFSNIDILDQHENQIDYQGCLSLNAGDSNLIRQIKFNDIRIDDIRKGQLVNFRVMFNHKYNTSAGRGIEDVYLKNITYNGTHANMSVITGYDDARSVKNVVFENLKINGRIITDDMPGKPGFYKTGDMANFFIGEHVDGLKFIKSGNSN